VKLFTQGFILALLCQRKDATVRELVSYVDAAYTTVMTTLDRLYKKGFLERMHDAERTAFRYRLKNGEREFYNLVLGPDLKSVLDLSGRSLHADVVPGRRSRRT